MSIRTTAVLPFVLTLALVAGAALAAPVSLTDLHDRQVALRSEVLEGKGAFRAMPIEQREAIAARQAALIALITGKASLDELDEHQKVDVAHALSWIESAVAGAEDDRIVCERTRPTGSNRTQRVCMTVAERRALREEAARSIADRAPICADGGGTCRRPILESGL